MPPQSVTRYQEYYNGDKDEQMTEADDGRWRVLLEVSERMGHWAL